MELANLFKALGDPNRLRILMLLSRKKMCVCELRYVLKVTQPSVSKHLKKLTSAGIIDSEQDGFWTNYRISNKVSPQTSHLLRQLRAWLRSNQQIQIDFKIARTADRKSLCRK